MLGGDLGGTSTRILISDEAGRVLGRGAAGGSNPVSHPETAAAALGTALREALDGLDPVLVQQNVIGAAGGVALARPEIAGQFEAAWSGAGLAGKPAYIGDLEVAFASATTAPDGTAVIVGTGAGAGEIRDHELIRTSDTNGWLLGDDGSGYWLGREAVRAALRSLDELTPLSPLGEAVVDALIGGRPADAPPETVWHGAKAIRDQLVRTANGRPPVRLAELAPTVSAAYDAGDPAATDIVERATDLLVETIERIRPAHSANPLVLAGSVAGGSSPVGRMLRDRLAALGAPVLTARNGVAGAAWLALARLDPALATDAAHEALLAG